MLLTTISVLHIASITALASGNIDNKENLENNLYIGDSFTVRMASELEDLNIEFSMAAEPSKTIADMKEFGLPDSNPNRIVLLGGINNFLTDTFTDDSGNRTVNIDSEIELIEQLQSKYDCPIYVQAVFPVSEIFKQSHPEMDNNEIEMYNLMLYYYCMNTDNVTYIDTRTGFTDENGYLINYDDGLHLSWDAYSIWLSNIAASIKGEEINK